MKLTKIFHSCIYFEDGPKVLIDPFNPSTSKKPYDYKGIQPNLILITHEHDDHNYGDPFKNVLRFDTPGNYEFQGIMVAGFQTFHDDKSGSERGVNTVFKIRSDMLDIVHMGDIGTMPDNDTLKEIKNCDILFLPVGGVYTVNAKQAFEIYQEIEPRIVVPIHYSDDNLSIELEAKEEFLKLFPTFETVKSLDDRSLSKLTGCVVLENQL